MDGRLPNGTVLHQTEHNTVRKEWANSIGGGAKASVMGDIGVLPYSVLPLAAVPMVALWHSNAVRSRVMLGLIAITSSVLAVVIAVFVSVQCDLGGSTPLHPA